MALLKLTLGNVFGYCIIKSILVKPITDSRFLDNTSRLTDHRYANLLLHLLCCNLLLASHLHDLLADLILQLSLFQLSLFQVVFKINFCFEIGEKLIDLVFALFVLSFQRSFLCRRTSKLFERPHHCYYQFKVSKTIRFLALEFQLLLRLDIFNCFAICLNLASQTKPKTQELCFGCKMRNLKQFLFSEGKVIRVKRDRIESLLFQSSDSTGPRTLKTCHEPLQHKFSPLVPLLFKLFLSVFLL